MLVMLSIPFTATAQVEHQFLGCYCIDPTFMTEESLSLYGSFAEARNACKTEADRMESGGVLQGALMTAFVSPFTPREYDNTRMKTVDDYDPRKCENICYIDSGAVQTKCIAVVKPNR